MHIDERIGKEGSSIQLKPHTQRGPSHKDVSALQSSPQLTYYFAALLPKILMDSGPEATD